MDVRAIYYTCMADASKYRLSATDVGAARRSPFSLYCKYHADRARMDPPDPFLEALSTRDIEHESAVLTSDYPNMEKVTYETPEDGFMAALKSMAVGSKAVSNLPLFYLPEGMHGYPDVLEKNAGGSAFGGHHYLVREIKAAKRIKEHHLIQAAFYAMLLDHIQQRPPGHFMITDGDGETTRYEYSDYDILLRESIIQAGRIRDGRNRHPARCQGAVGGAICQVAPLCKGGLRHGLSRAGVQPGMTFLLHSRGSQGSVEILTKSDRPDSPCSLMATTLKT